MHLCSNWGIGTLTVYAFSTENWSRPSEEVNFLMTLFESVLKRELTNLKLMTKPIVISDPYPRTLDLIFTKKKLKELKSKYKIINAPQKNKKKFYEENIQNALFIMGQPNLDKKLLSKAKKLKAIINVESNFIKNMDYEYCFKKGIHVIATSPVFSKPVAEIALGMTLSLLRNIHIAHSEFI